MPSFVCPVGPIEITHDSAIHKTGTSFADNRLTAPTFTNDFSSATLVHQPSHGLLQRLSNT